MPPPQNSLPNVAVLIEDGGAACSAVQELADRLGLPRVTEPSAEYPLVLAWTDQRLEIRRAGEGTGRLSQVFVDFVHGAAARRWREPLSARSAIARAVGIGRGAAHQTVLDVNAGLGRDAFLLACHGCQVRAVERSPVVAALLLDGLERALADPTTMQRLTGRGGSLRIECAEAEAVLAEVTTPPDVIYLDPMLPPTGKSARVKKDMRLLQELLGPDRDAAEILTAARARARRRTVVKRPRRASPLAPGPDAVIRSPRARWDVYLTGEK